MSAKQNGMYVFFFEYVNKPVQGSAAVIYPARLQYERQKEFYENTRAVADRVRAERDILQKEVSALESSPAAIERIARENYRLCKEGEIVLYYKKPKK